MLNRLLQASALVLLFGSACTNEERIAVTEENELHITALEAAQFEDHGDKIFELRAFDGADQQVASVRKRVGTVTDLLELQPGVEASGSEIVISVGDEHHREYSREQQAFFLAGTFAPAIQHFLAIREVASALASRASITVAAGNVAPDGDAAESAFTTQACPASYLNSAIQAKQCCYTSMYALTPSGWATIRYTLFMHPTNIVPVTRQYSGSSTFKCKSQTGGSCIGLNCFWGPNGFARPTMTDHQPNMRIESRPAQEFGFGGTDTGCRAISYATWQTVIFGNLYGNFGAACGCACDGSGRTCFDSTSQAANAGGLCPQANGLVCNQTGTCPAGGGGGADQFGY